MFLNINNFKNNNKKKITGIIYGKNYKNKKIEFIKKNIYYEKLKENKELNLKIINKIIKVKIKEIQKHPYKKEILHVDFFVIDE